MTSREKKLLKTLKKVRPMQVWGYDKGVFVLSLGTAEKHFSADEVVGLLEADLVEFRHKVSAIEEVFLSQ